MSLRQPALVASAIPTMAAIEARIIFSGRSSSNGVTLLSLRIGSHSVFPTSCGCLAGPKATFETVSQSNFSSANFKVIVTQNGVS